MRSMQRLSLCLALAAAACGDDDAAVRDDAGRGHEGDDGGLDATDDGSAPRDMDAGEGPSADCNQAIPSFGEVQIFAKCLGCHATEVTGSARQGAPPSANLDDYDSAAAVAERAALYVFHGIMPPPVTGITVTEAEKEQLYLWALCGTPE